MIAVSDSFKKAIKSENREIHGYVEIEYQKKDFDTTVSNIPTQLEMFDENGIINGSKIMQKYATLENNYTLLDGSFMVWNENIILNDGYISKDTFENINETITITNNSTNTSTKGITIYFKDNLPFDFTVTITTVDNEQIIDNIIGNQSYNYQYLFNEEVYISNINIDIQRVEHPDNRLRISYVDFNISDLYEGEELVKFEITEEIDLLFDTVPVGTCTINLNNYPDEYGKSKFDIINQQGITPYLNENTTAKPYIGVLTELNGIEYVPMGVFYLRDWSSEEDGNVTMNCENVVSRLQTLNIVSDGNFLEDYKPITSFNSYFHETTGYDFNLTSVNYAMHCSFLNSFNLMDWLKCFIISQTIMYNSEYNTYTKKQFYITRNNVTTVDDLSNNIVDSISRNELKSDVHYETKPIINEVEISDIGYARNYDSTRKELLDETYTLTSDVDYVWYKLSEMCTGHSLSYTVISGNATAELVDHNFFMVYVRISGTVGSEIRLSCTAYPYQKTSERTLTFNNNQKSGDKLQLNYDQYWQYLLKYRAEEVANYCLTQDKKYKISAQTMGDPSIESRDKVSIQTRYTDINNGYKDVIITKQHFIFDGGLQCDIEGVGN